MDPLPPPTGMPVADVPPPAPEGSQSVPDGPAGWRWWQGVLGLLGALVGASVAGALVFFAAVIFGGDPSDPTGGMYMGALAAQNICFVGFSILFATMRGGKAAPWMFGIRRPQRGWRHAAAWIVLVYIGLIAISAAWSQIVDIDGGQITDDLGVKANDVAAITGAFLVCVGAPIAEEFLFRGLLFPALRGSIGTAWAAIATGLLFGGVHVVGSPAGALPILVLFGVLLCVVYLKTKSLVPCMLLHAINNSIAYGSLVDWTWQAGIVLLGSLVLILAAVRAVESRFGLAPAHLSSI